jgi:CBS domain-containing protein
VAGFTRPLVLEGGALFPLQTEVLGSVGLISCVVAGLLAGAMSWGLSTALYKMEDLFGKLPIHWMWWPAIGGLAIGIGGYFQPRALGVGYDVIGDLLHNNIAIGAVIALILVKATIWVISLASGTSGGVLAPLLMMGAALGAVLGPYLPGGEPALWPMVFMAATLGGMMRAPIMSVIFAFELTHDINALLPLLATSAVAYGFTVLMMPRSILTEKIARRGYHIYREYGIDPLERHFVTEVMTAQPKVIDASMSPAAAFEQYFGASQAHRAYPVVREGRFLGMVDRANVLAGMAAEDAPTMADLFGVNVPVMALPGETCRVVSNRLAVLGLERVAVVADARSRRLLGVISRSDLIKPSLYSSEEEERREVVRRTPVHGFRDWLAKRVAN